MRRSTSRRLGNEWCAAAKAGASVGVGVVGWQIIDVKRLASASRHGVERNKIVSLRCAAEYKPRAYL